MQWRIQDFPLGVANSRRSYVSSNLYVKTKELGPLRGAPGVSLGSATAMMVNTYICSGYIIHKAHTIFFCIYIVGFYLIHLKCFRNDMTFAYTISENVYYKDSRSTINSRISLKENLISTKSTNV